MPLKLIATVGFVLISGFVLAQTLYSWKDENGKTYYSDKKPTNVTAREVNAEINGYTPSQAEAATLPNVEFYATRWCGYCKRARQYFKDNNIPYTEYDIERDSAANARHKAFGGRGVPLMVVNDKVMKGFNAERFAHFYERAQ